MDIRGIETWGVPIRRWRANCDAVRLGRGRAPVPVGRRRDLLRRARIGELEAPHRRRCQLVHVPILRARRWTTSTAKLSASTITSSTKAAA